MALSVFDLFKIGIGPSSSHTVGPMKAAALFARRLGKLELLPQTARIEAKLYGSLGATGKGHGTDTAVMLGLEGAMPDTIDPDSIDARIKQIRAQNSVLVDGKHAVAFRERTDILFLRRESLPFHSNGVRFSAFAADGTLLEERRYFSVGGGFVVSQEEADAVADTPRFVVDPTVLAHPFSSGDALLAITVETGLSIAQVMRKNEHAWRTDAELDEGLDRIWDAMKACVDRGCRTDGHLPGSMRVKRRAAELHRSLSSRPEQALKDQLTILDFVNVYAMAVNEENAAGGRVVTAPTNGAAGIVPAVMHYYDRFCSGASKEGVRDFLLTAGAIGLLYKENASISGAEVGCQGEVGVACSMAAAGLAAVMGGTPEQVENAAEIGMEHNLGLTCDPVGGRVQIPCIERNAMGSVKALNAARMALRGDGTHFVSLDQVIKTMRDTGRDMMTKYKETSRGGLAVNVIEC
ncbi:MAG TPA: L-serine ammonia-lyase [Burkholderiaceae bacterium]|jgi:L-serine dehydratase|nr:L-serine ammonia-lyase [Rhodoferax sp.]HNW01276.1 L-serine ammonia-lyase [Burkholderiaceae bacterium]HPW06935.1 L-serine ammonia-lyase [Burkholderiaceae bacterium]